MATVIVMGFDEYFDNCTDSGTCHMHTFYLSYH